MSRIFTSGAEWGDLLDFNGGTTGSTTISSLIKRTGNYAYSLTDVGAATSFAVVNLASALDEIFIKFYAYISTVTAGDRLIRIRSGTTVLATLNYVASGSLLTAYRGDGVTLLGTSSISFPADQQGRIEIHFKLSDTVGEFNVKIGGVDCITFTGDTKPGADATFTNVQFCAPGSLGTMYLDDIAFNDTAGLVDNSWVGDGGVELKLPVSDGDTVQWTNSAGNQVNNWDYVNNLPPAAPYIEDSTAGNVNLCNLSALDITGKTVLRTWVEGRALDTVGGEAIKLDLKTGGLTHQSGDVALTTASARVIGPDYTTNPTTSAAWTQAQLDAAQVSPETV